MLKKFAWIRTIAVLCSYKLIKPKTKAMKRYILRTKDRQGEFLKPEYKDKQPDPQTGWNHFIHWNRNKVLEYAQKNNIVGYIERIEI